ncbi:MAG: DNA mismatch repair protein MutS [Acidobacteria bacterium CG_4_9_14_3_um_filter_49_7]|nr:MAG: DNA mismatch repair protein MutS [Acidobacteria bacterium CG_4_9_14_3_um_filter_49_7]
MQLAIDKTRLTPALRQFMEAKEEYPDHILFFRMGDFYEMFFDDAIKASRTLEITLTKRGKGTFGEAPMCGVPWHAYETYAAKLLKAGFKVAVCEQVEDPKLAKGVVKRAVVTVLTPATSHLNTDENTAGHGLLSIYADEKKAGLVFGDPTTGECRLMEVPVSILSQKIQLLVPREIVAPFGVVSSAMLSDFRNFSPMINEFDEGAFESRMAAERVRELFEVSTVAGFGIKGKKHALRALGGYFHYLEENYKTRNFAVRGLVYSEESRQLIVDPVTRKNLELFTSAATGKRNGSLLWALDRTISPMGQRKLVDWIQFPLKDAGEIESRLSVVEWFLDAPQKLGKIRDHLSMIGDMERIITRVTLGTVSPPELTVLKKALGAIPLLQEVLDDAPFHELRAGFHDLESVFLKLDSVLEETAPRLKGPGMIRAGVSDELDRLRGIARNVRTAMGELEQKERGKTGIPSLKIKYNKVFGYYIEISKASLRGKTPEGYDRKQTLVNAERFITPELKVFEEQVLHAEERILEIETETFNSLVAEVSGHRRAILETADTVGVVDTLACFAFLSLERDYRRPEVVPENRIYVEQGRHPVVELIEGEHFVPNDTDLDASRRLAIITGPNMGGKSTYLRQNALITLMAHMGCFVPARRAVIGLTDRIFTRVGSSDNLTGGESTFMVEMVETANILRNATERSLIILDEVGRGTATFDGLSLAWAITEFLAEKEEKCPRTFFATHYHELTDIDKLFQNIVNLNVVVKEWNNELLFLRKIVAGAADKSYGIQVARLAGIPRAVITRAFEVLANIEKNEFTLNGEPKIAGPPLRKAEERPLFNWDDHPVLVELKNTDVDSLTPLEALNFLARLKEGV